MGQNAPHYQLEKLPPLREKVETIEILRQTNKSIAALVELKALIKLEDVHLEQAINYLEAYDLEVGLLINFGAKSLDFKRLNNKKFNQKNQGNPQIL